MHIKSKVCQCLSYQFDTPCYYNNTSNCQPGAYVLCERPESSEGFRADMMTVIPSTQLNMCRTVTIRKILTDIMVTQGASKSPVGAIGDAWQDVWSVWWFYLKARGTEEQIRGKCSWKSTCPHLLPINRLLPPERLNVDAGESTHCGNEVTMLHIHVHASAVTCRSHKGDSYPHKC